MFALPTWLAFWNLFGWRAAPRRPRTFFLRDDDIWCTDGFAVWRVLTSAEVEAFRQRLLRAARS